MTRNPFFISKGFAGHVWQTQRSIQSDPLSAYITSSSLRCFPYVPSALACMAIISAQWLHNIVYLSSPRATSSTNRGPVSAEEQGLHQTFESLTETHCSAKSGKKVRWGLNCSFKLVKKIHIWQIKKNTIIEKCLTNDRRKWSQKLKKVDMMLLTTYLVSKQKNI